MPAESDRLHRDLGRVIATRAKDIEARWLERVLAEVAGKIDVELTHLRDGIPDYLAALGRLLSESGREDNGAVSWAQVARDHGITRVRVGFDIEQLVREFVTLRKVIEEVAAEDLVIAAPAGEKLADLIEAAITTSVGAYVERRDYEARRRQAENIGFLIHELRNPLMAAVSSAALAREHAVPAQHKAFEILERGHRRLTELIDGVLLTEKLEAGRAEPHPVELRIGDLLDGATLAARKAAADKGLVLEIHADPEQRIRADPELTRSALQNVVDNAVKYTDRGRVEIAVEAHERDCTIHVRDTCPGLSREELRTIFEPFRRGSTTKKGTGLGLAIAKRAIEAQGGSIHAESTAAEGCHFWLTLPKR